MTENPVSGERVRRLLTANDTGGRLARAGARVRRGGGVLVEHRRPASEERFEVLAGARRLRTRPLGVIAPPLALLARVAA